MPVFGQFETVEEIARGAVCSVFSARRAGEPGPATHVLKVCHPPVLVDPRLAEQRVGQFLRQAEAQKALSVPGSRWAPIHAIERLPEGAYYVTDYFTLSAEKLVEGHVPLTEAELLGIITSITKGLIALHDASSRPHGNLKRTNVLITRGARPPLWRIVLADPLPPDQVNDRRDTEGDLTALGRLLYALVCRTEFPGPSMLPIKPTGPWARFKSRATTWCEVCNKLMAPESDDEPLALDELARLLAGLAGGLARSRRTIWVAAGICGAVLAAAAGLLVFLPRPLPITPEKAQEELGELCEVLAGGAWLDQVILHVVMDKDVPVFELVKEVEKSARSIQEGFGKVGGTKFLCPKEGELTDGEIRAIDNANLDLNKIRQQFADWAVPRELTATADTFQTRGWSTLANRLRTLATDADPTAGRDWRAAWDEIAAILAIDAGNKDDVLKQIEQALNGLTAAIKELNADSAMQDLQLSVSDVKVIEALESSSDGQPLLAQLSSLLDSLVRLPQSVANLRSALPEIVNARKVWDGCEYANQTEQLKATFKDIVERLGGLSAQSRGTDLPKAVAALVDDCHGIARDVAECLKNPCTRRDQLVQGASPPFEHPEVQRALSETISGLLAPHEEAFRANCPDLADVLARRALNATLDDVDSRLNALKPKLGDLDRWWSQTLKGSGHRRIADPLIEQRDALLKGMLAAMSSDDWLSKQQEWQRFIGRADQAAELATALEEISIRLDAGSRLTDDALQDNARSLGARYDQAAGSAAFKDFGDLYKDLNDRVALTRTIANAHDRRSVLPSPEEQRPDVVLACWDAVVRLSQPGNKGSIDDEVVARERALQTIVAIRTKDDKRGDHLQVELDDQSRRLFVNHALKVSDPARDAEWFGPLVNQLNGFGLTVESLEKVPPEVSYNVGLAQLVLIAPGPGSDETADRAKVEAFVTKATNTPALAQRPDVDNTIKVLTNVLEKGVDPHSIGPAAEKSRIPWSFDSDRSTSDTTLWYTWKRTDANPISLAFKLVEYDGGQIYMCTDEVSVGLFIDLIQAAGEWGQLKHNEGRGLRAWKWNGDQMTPVTGGAESWMDPALDFRYYANPGNPGQRVPAEPPSRAHPMHQINAKAALLAAGLINCDLPTVDEWKAAVLRPTWEFFQTPCPKLLQADAGRLADERPNLRDETWARLLGYLKQRRPAGVDRDPVQEELFMYPDDGIFWGKGVARQLAPNEGPGLGWDDGTLWFVRTAEIDGSSLDGSSLHNLIGNVAEFVLANRSVAAPDVLVIGGSALCDPCRMPVCEAQVIADRTSGFSDVGFRLAIPVDQEVTNFYARLKRIFDPHPPLIPAAADRGNH